MAETGKKPRRRWFQFSLRALLVLTALVAAAAWAWRAYLEPYRKQRQTLALIEELRGSCQTAEASAWLRRMFGGDFQNIVLINLADCDEPAKYIDPVAALPELEMLAVGGPAFGDNEVQRLQPLKTLRGLVLDSTSVTPDAVAAFRAAMPDVEVFLSQRRNIEPLANLGYVGRSLGPFFAPRFGPNDLFGEAESFSASWKAGIRDDDIALMNGLSQLRHIDFACTKVGDAGLKHLNGVRTLQWLCLDWTQVTDAGLEHLKSLPELHQLYLSDTQVSDAGLIHLEAMTQLTYLTLRRTRVTDTGLVHLKGLTNLSYLDVSGTTVGDEGVQHFKGLNGLFSLGLEQTQITDAALVHLEPHLKRMRRFHHLDVRRTKVTAAGVDQLRKAAPKCKILSDFD